MVNKIITPPTTSELIGKVNEIIDDKQDVLTSEYAGNCIEIAIGSSSGLPAEYQELEYLQSSGTQWIDTGVVLDKTMTIRTKYDFIRVGFVFGSRASNTYQYSGITNETTGFYNIRYGNTVIFTQNRIPSGTVDVVISPNGVVLNGEVVSTSAYGNGFYAGNCYLFTVNNNGSPTTGEYAINRIRRFTIDNVIDLVPCKRKSDDVLGMYDLINDEFLTNAGTGTFTAGENVEETTKISFVNDAGYATESYVTTAVSGKQDTLTQTQLDAVNSGANQSNIAQITANQSNINNINSLIPAQASSANQLADKDFVNSSIATNTATFRGTFNSVAELEAYSGEKDNNDYAFVTGTDQAGNTYYDRYKYNDISWVYEYRLNNSSFTSVQWASINSGATTQSINQISTNTANISSLQTSKQDTLVSGTNIKTINNTSILGSGNINIQGGGSYTAGTGIDITNDVISVTNAISTGATLGATAVQPSALATKQDVLTSENAGTNISIIEGTSTEEVETGISPISLETVTGLNYIKAFGATEQNGTPTPATPIDIVCNNGVLNVNRNLYSTEYHDKVLSQQNGVSVSTGDGINVSGMVDCTSVKSFMITSAAPKGSYRIFKYRANKTFINASSLGDIGYILTLEDNVGFFRIQYNYTNISTGTENILIYNRAYNLNEIYADGTQETVSITNGGTANAEMLLSVGDYQDNQELLTGNITRKVGIKVLDGTENWVYESTYNRFMLDSLPNFYSLGTRLTPFICTHFIGISDGRLLPDVPNNSLYTGAGASCYIKTTDYTTLTAWKQYLAEQYANGTPVIVVYPLATSTTETVTGQSLTASGDCTVTATGSLNNLELEVGYFIGSGVTTISFTNDSGYITSSALNGYATENWVGQQGYITGITSSDVTTALGYTPYNSSNPNNYQTAIQVANSIATETTNRENADNNLQSQIDAIVSSSDVFDVVGTYAELQAYDITTVPVNDIIKVLVDSTHSGAATYYRCVETGGVKSWSYIGSEGAYYTKAEAEAAFVPQTRTVNNKALSANITLTATDVGADVSGAASTAEINAKNYADGLATNYATAAQGALADTAVQPADLATVATSGSYNDLSNKPTAVTESTVSGWGFTKNTGTVTSVNNVSPVNGNVTLSIPTVPTNISAFTNDSGYITSSALAPYALSSSLATVATSGSYNDLSNKPMIPTVNDATLTIQKNGTNVATFTANASSNVTANISVPTNTNELTNGAGFITSSALSGYEQTSNKVTSISSSSTNTQYPSAKCVYDIVGDIETLINAL